VQKIRVQKFSANFKKSKVNFVPEVFFFEQRAFEKILGFVLMQMCACSKEHMREVIDCVLRCFHGLPWQRCQLESPKLQQAKHATSS